MTRIRVIHFLSSNQFSGAENVACQIINAFSEKSDIEMVYCCPEGHIQEALAYRNIRFEPLKNLSVKEFRKVVKKVNPTVIHAHDMRASFIASVAVRGIKLISHIHNNNFNSRHFSIKSLLYAYAAFRASHIFWVSKSSFDGYVFHKLFSGKSSILYNVIDINSLEKKADEMRPEVDYDVVYMGRLNYLKNPLRLMSILRRLIEINTDVRIAIIGDGDLRSEVEENIIEGRLQNNISYLGFLSNPYVFLKNAKCMIMTSRTEGLPMCALESMSLGIPIVSTPVGGLVELIDNGIDGILSDDDDVIVSSLNEIISKSCYQHDLSQKAREKMKKLQNLELYRSKLLEVYQ